MTDEGTSSTAGRASEASRVAALEAWLLEGSPPGGVPATLAHPTLTTVVERLREGLTAALAPPLPLVARALAQRVVETPTDELERLDVGGLLVALGAAADHAPSVSSLDGLILAQARRVQARDSAAADELAQAVRVRLLAAAPGGERRIAEYSGEGSLVAWLRAVSVRVHLNARRSAVRELPLGETSEPSFEGLDPELALLRAQHRANFRAAFTAALAGLSSRERTLLRLHTLDGLTLARIGTMYRRDASTISRWLEAARGAVLAATRAHLAEALRLDSAALDSLMRAADHELSVSLGQLLEPPVGVATPSTGTRASARAGAGAGAVAVAVAVAVAGSDSDGVGAHQGERSAPRRRPPQ